MATENLTALPLDIQMQIDLSAQAHHREIAQSFAKVRDELLAPIVYFSHDEWPHFITLRTMGEGAVIKFKDCRVLGPLRHGWEVSFTKPAVPAFQ